jgi:hypothetical protein
VNQTVRNERLKLTANFCNIVASAIIVTGAMGPLVTLLYSRMFAGTDPAEVVVGSLVCLLVGGSIHLYGQAVLGGLE